MKLSHKIIMSVAVFGSSSALFAASTTTDISKIQTASGTVLTATSSQESTSTACKREALEAREDMLAQARTTYNVNMKVALDARKKALKVALTIASDSDREEAKLQAYDTYKASTTESQRVIAAARKQAWVDFEDDMKKCTEIKKAEAKKTIFERLEDRKTDLEILIEKKKDELMKKLIQKEKPQNASSTPEASIPSVLPREKDDDLP